jgi:hypothetical protein
LKLMTINLNLIINVIPCRWQCRNWRVDHDNGSDFSLLHKYNLKENITVWYWNWLLHTMHFIYLYMYILYITWINQENLVW